MSTSYASVQPDAPTRFQCRHIFPDGHRCGSPCLRKENFCYYHHTSRHAVRLRELEARKAQQAGLSPQQAVFDLPADLTDRSGLQVAIGEVLQRIARNEIDPRRAGLLLYGLQIAGMTLPYEPRPEPASYSPATGYIEATPAPPKVEEVEFDPELGALAPVTAIIKERSWLSRLKGKECDAPAPAANASTGVMLPDVRAVAASLEMDCHPERSVSQASPRDAQSKDLLLPVGYGSGSPFLPLHAERKHRLRVQRLSRLQQRGRKLRMIG